jgi:DNA-binding transcriptional LysR family regulator
MPKVLARLEQQHPQVQLGLRTGLQAQMETWLLERQIDLAIVSLENKPAARLRTERLIKLPPVLLVPKSSPYQSANDLWKQKKIAEPLISLPASEALSRLFQKGLKQHKLDWAPVIEASSYEMITWFVAHGYGLGVNVNLPEIVTHPKVRVLPLPGFKPVEIVAMWAGQPTAFLKTVLEEIQRYAAQAQP